MTWFFVNSFLFSWCVGCVWYFRCFDMNVLEPIWTECVWISSFAINTFCIRIYNPLHRAFYFLFLHILLKNETSAEAITTIKCSSLREKKQWIGSAQKWDKSGSEANWEQPKHNPTPKRTKQIIPKTKKEKNITLKQWNNSNPQIMLKTTLASSGVCVCMEIQFYILVNLFCTLSSLNLLALGFVLIILWYFRKLLSVPVVSFPCGIFNVRTCTSPF